MVIATVTSHLLLITAIISILWSKGNQFYTISLGYCREESEKIKFREIIILKVSRCMYVPTAKLSFTTHIKKIKSNH